MSSVSALCIQQCRLLSLITPEELRILRIQYGVTQSELGRVLAYTTRQVRNLENGTTRITVRHQAKILTYFASLPATFTARSA
jgi:transcriptional regulator with XRE-family HTH domain